MTRGEIHEFVTSWVRAWTAEDLEALLACYDDDAELVSPLLGTVRGISAIERSHQDLFLAFADVEVEVHDVVVDEEQQRAVLIFTIHATQQGEFLGFPASRRRTATPSAYAFTLKNGRIGSERRLYDYAGFLMQLGILKTRNV